MPAGISKVFNGEISEKIPERIAAGTPERILEEFFETISQKNSRSYW